MTRETALGTLHSNLESIKRFGVERIGLFGSLARSEANTESDIDVLVTFSKGSKTFDNYMGLRFYLETLFDGHPIDLVVEDTVKPRIKASVFKDAVYAS